MVGSKTICSLLMLMAFTLPSAKTLRDLSVEDSKPNVGTGEIIDVDPTKPKYHVMAEQSLIQYEEQNNLNQGYVVFRVMKVTEQVVSGLLTRIDFLAILRLCKQGSQHRTSNCQVHYPGSTLLCYSEIWDQNWLHRRETTVTCEPPLTGGS
ncbi:cystatin cpi-2-like [Danaus plexippus]|uniref:cystatin cpi-2-like n=1 Tax=Danaus plexippus TaxID=13037 RepID=UPI002AB276B3|nr:cystatin cpi-2-like [Danaus plexippus]